MQQNALVNFSHGPGDIATHHRTFKDFLECIPFLSIMLRNGDGLDFLILILWGSMLIEGEPDTGIAELLAVVSWPDRSADVHMSKSLLWSEQDLVLESDRDRWRVAEALEGDRVQALVVFREEEIQVGSDVDDNGRCSRGDVELHFYLGELVLHPPQEFEDRVQG